MNAMMLALMMRGGRIDRGTLSTLTARANEKRKKLFTKLADLLFGLVMFFFGDLEFTFTKDGKTLDASSKEVTADDKLNAIMGGLKATQKSTLFRELLRPFLISAAEVLADLMAPDDMVLHLLSSDGGGSGGAVDMGGVPALPGVGGPTYIPGVSGASPVSTVATKYDGQLVTADGGDGGKVYRVYSGSKHHVTSPAVFERRGYDWGRIQTIPLAEINAIPTGISEN